MNTTKPTTSAKTPVSFTRPQLFDIAGRIEQTSQLVHILSAMLTRNPSDEPLPETQLANRIHDELRNVLDDLGMGLDCEFDPW